MSIDEEIRDLLNRAGADGTSGVDPSVMGRIVDRAERRRRRKVLVGGTVVVALAVAVLALIPAAMESRGDEAPVDLPNPTVKHEPDRGQDDQPPALVGVRRRVRPRGCGAPPDVVLRMLLTSSYFSYHAGF